MIKGMIFDIKEFALNDGPGIRTTVFMKGCPLRCKWCHNPEGLISSPQQMRSTAGSRIVGREYELDELAAILLANSDIMNDTGGGVTFSGGEPLMQADFLVELFPRLTGIHVLLDTSGYGDSEVFARLAFMVDQVYFDLKIIDPSKHNLWTGQNNELILENLLILDELAVDYTVRIPLIPLATDTSENLTAIADFVGKLRNVREINLLPYNVLAGGKYESVGMTYPLNSQQCSDIKPLCQNIFSSSRFPVKFM